MCEVFGIELELSPPRAIYNHGWGIECSQAKQIRYYCYLTVFDTQGLPTTIPFYLVEGNSPVVIGMDIERYANINSMDECKQIEFKRPHDNSKLKFLTYVETDANGDERLRLDVATNRKSSVTSLMANIKKRPELNLVKKIHRFTHGNKDELTKLLTEAGMKTERMEKAIKKETSS